jgi:fibro-slime domain-containing protein
MWRKVALCIVPVQVVALALLYAGTSSAQDGLDLPGIEGAPESVTLAGTIRDFKASHPDFEYVIADDHAITTSTIGADRKPVYASAGSTPTTTGKANFDQWYRDVPDVNLSTEYALSLHRIADSDPPVYRFASDNFFPIDDRLWGNEGQAHNYWFSYELHNSFTYRGGERFNFTGDDDVWVYINGRKVIDLGGVHGAEAAAVTLDGIAGELGLVKGQTYPFDMFFAERHTSQSNFVAETSIVLEPPTQEPPTTEPPSDEKPSPPPKKP